MIVLVCNVGSTSLKFKLYDMPEARVLAVSGIERVGSDHDAIFRYERCEDAKKDSFEKGDIPFMDVRYDIIIDISAWLTKGVGVDEAFSFRMLCSESGLMISVGYIF